MGYRYGGLDIAPARAKLFMHGGSQAVRLPKAFRLEGSEVTVWREGDKVILEPIPKPPRTPEQWTAFWAAIDNACEEPFPERQPEPPFERDIVDLD